MGMTIDEMISFCEEEEQNHRVKGKRADDASGYTRSKDKNIRTAVAIREEIYGNYYKQIADIMRKYQKIQEAYKKYLNDMVTNIYADGKFIVALRGILEDENND